jgi:hypothetical protein
LKVTVSNIVEHSEYIVAVTHRVAHFLIFLELFLAKVWFGWCQSKFKSFINATSKLWGEI